jgi:hypothetical protein
VYACAVDARAALSVECLEEGRRGRGNALISIPVRELVTFMPSGIVGDAVGSFRGGLIAWWRYLSDRFEGLGLFEDSRNGCLGQPAFNWLV